MQFTTCTIVRTPPAPQFGPGLWRKPPMRLEYGAPEETKIRGLESQIGKARRNGTPVDSLIEERRRTYESWIERLDREMGGELKERDREKIRQQRERAIRDYKWPDAPVTRSKA